MKNPTKCTHAGVRVMEQKPTYRKQGEKNVWFKTYIVKCDDCGHWFDQPIRGPVMGELAD